MNKLENARRIIARLYDRGPCVGDRVIDLSRRSAELLDVVRKGTAKVRVRRVYPPEDVRLALRGGGKSAGAVQMASAAPPPVRPPVPAPIPQTATPAPVAADVTTPPPVPIRTVRLPSSREIGKASCRATVCQDV